MKFAKPYPEYTQNLDIMTSYMESSVTALTRACKITESDAEEFVKAQPEYKEIHDKTIKFLHRSPDGSRKEHEVSVLKYLDRMGESTNVLTPTFTSFLSKDVKEAPQPKYIRRKMKERKKVKGAAHVASNNKDFTKSTILTGIQNAIKILINSFSGASLSAFNPFYSGSLHQVLCAMCRCSTAVATSIIERLLAGSRFYHRPSLVTDDLLQTIVKINRTEIQMAINALNLAIPTKKDCLDIIRISAGDYWWGEEGEQEFMPVLDAMDDLERAAFAYSVDLYHLFKLNPEVMHGILSDLSFNDYESLDTDVAWVMDKLSDDERALITGLIGEDIKGTFLRDNLNEGNPMRPKINALAHRLLDKLSDFSVLASAFFLTDILPIDIGNQDSSIRYATSLGDTDSCLYTTMHINKLFYGKADFTEAQNPITELCIFFANGVIEHGLGVYSGQMNVHPDDRYELSLKNEYRFNSLQLTPYKKTYFASVASQEGAVFADDNRHYEIKGARFHSGKSNRDMVTELHKWMKDVPWKLKRGEGIARNELIDIVERIEKEIDSSLDYQGNHKFQTLKIKDYESYSNPKSQPWKNHLLWNWCFGDTHGYGGDEGYTSFKLPLKFEGGLEAFLENTTPKIRDGFDKYMDYITNGDKSKRSGKGVTFMTIPVDSMINHGVPKEIASLVDLDKTIKQAVDPHLLTLANMGIVMFKDDKSSGDNKVIQKRITDLLI